jgi:hypothetical protein
MQRPSVHNERLDKENQVVYDVVAYRELREAEIVMAIRAYLSRRPKRRPKRGTRVTIVTIIGFRN